VGLNKLLFLRLEMVSIYQVSPKISTGFYFSVIFSLFIIRILCDLKLTALLFPFFFDLIRILSEFAFG
jgi:hypothetical protein